MLETRISMLDAAYFLIDQYDYERISVVNQQLDIWLVNKSTKKYPIIRLTALSLSEGIQQKEAVVKQALNISQLLNVKDELLNIHFNDNLLVEIQSYNYHQALVNSRYTTAFLNEDFKGFTNSIKPIGDNLENELKRRELKILDLDSKRKKRSKFTFSMIGPTQVILLINALVFMLTTFLVTDFGRSLTALIMGALYKNFIYGANEWWRLITAGFLHVDFFHVLMNMIVLYQAGTIVERVFGKKQMFAIYMVSILSSSLLALVMMDGGTISLGASGGVFGLMGAIVVYLFSSNLVKVPQVRNQILSTLLANLLISLLPGISFWGHLGGFIGGILMATAVSEAKSFKTAKIHAYISTALIIIGMFIYSIFMDNNVYNVKSQMDKLSIQAYRELGLNGYANKIDNDLKVYYKSIGESYE